MKYIIGSLIISFGILLVGFFVLNSMNVQAPENTLEYLGIAWLVLAVVCYPLARRLIRE
jgi:drug/metabolite transporter (DMT)-like permease